MKWADWGGNCAVCCSIGLSTAEHCCRAVPCRLQGRPASLSTLEHVASVQPDTNMCNIVVVLARVPVSTRTGLRVYIIQHSFFLIYMTLQCTDSISLYFVLKVVGVSVCLKISKTTNPDILRNYKCGFPEVDPGRSTCPGYKGYFVCFNGFIKNH